LAPSGTGFSLWIFALGIYPSESSAGRSACRIARHKVEAPNINSVLRAPILLLPEIKRTFDPGSPRKTFIFYYKLKDKRQARYPR
jgi:hypothetical protein